MWFNDGHSYKNDKGKKNFSDGGEGLNRVMVSYGNVACDDWILLLFFLNIASTNLHVPFLTQNLEFQKM
jgi:CobQ-like glutamine amidotransferase family enzyme